MTFTPILLGEAGGLPLHFPALFFVAQSVLVALLAETWSKRAQVWALPSAFVYLTIFAWYFVDLFITPENYDFLPDSSLNFSYLQVMIFLGGYRLLVPWMTTKLAPKADASVVRQSPRTLQSLFRGTIALWLVLTIYGVVRMEGNILGTFFPLDARSGGGSMWARAAAGDAGPAGFIVSTATYIHLLVCASFGVWFFFVRGSSRMVALFLMVITWPYFLLSGTRSVFLAVSLPFFFAYLLFARQRLVVKLVCLVVAFFLVDSGLRTVIIYRNVGFRGVFSGEQATDDTDRDTRHQGLNMIQELCFVDIFEQQTGPAYGGRYLIELCNVIPRAIWPSKPLISIDYSIFRGFEGGDSDIGVVATISTGMIGGGVLNFGPYFGPLAPAALMALWVGLLSRWWRQRASFLRCFLFLAGLGLTFNLGRDITLLVLWPVVFGYLIVRLVEASSRNRPGAKRGVPRLVRPLHPSDKPPVSALVAENPGQGYSFH